MPQRFAWLLLYICWREFHSELKIKLKAAIKNNVQLLSTMPLTEGYNIAQSKKNDITKTLRICLKSTTQ